MSAKAFDSDLGMPSRSNVLRQLEVDLPRCVVTMDGRRTFDALDAMRRCPFPRMATQAVLAPVVEWFVSNDVVVHEDPENRAMSVEVDTARRGVLVKKSFVARDWSGEFLTRVRVRVDVSAPSDAVIVSLRRRNHASTTVMRQKE